MQSEAGAAGALHGALQKGAFVHDLHRVAGPVADDPQHVQDRRRADAGGHPRRRPHRGHARAVDLRRPQRRHGTPARPAGRCWPPARCRRPTTSPWSRTPRRCASRVPFLHFFDGFRTSHEINKIALLERATTSAPWSRDERRRSTFRARGLTPDAPGAAGHGPEPRRLLPGSRGGQPLLPRRARHRRRRAWTSSRDAHRPALRPGRLPRRSRRRARRRRHGLGRGRRRGDRRRP